MCSSDLPEMLPAEITMSLRNPTIENGMNTASSGTYFDDNSGTSSNLSSFIGTPLAKFERDFIEETITFCDGSIPQAARLLDVSPSTLYRKKESWDKT